MTRSSFALITAHAGATAWLAYLAAESLNHGQHHTAFLLAVAGLLAYVAAVRECFHGGTARQLFAAGGAAADAVDAVVAVAVAGGCCEAWWASCGEDHTPDCRTQGARHAKPHDERGDPVCTCTLNAPCPHCRAEHTEES
jgi:hypothetical protein